MDRSDFLGTPALSQKVPNTKLGKNWKTTVCYSFT